MGNYTRWYRVGNVKLVQNSRTIEGTDTYWLTAGLNPGDLFTIDGAQFYEVDSITDNTHLTLKNTYTGVSVNDSQYSIIRNFTATMPADIAARTAQLLGDFRKYIDTDMRSIHGQSAYELALENGYVGTEQQWLESLKAAGEWADIRSEVTSYENTTDGRVTALETGQGKLSSLGTSAKSNLVSAVNEVSTVATEGRAKAIAASNNIGTLTSLTTDAKSTLVAAVNELDKRVHYMRKWWDGATGWNTLNTTISNLRNTQVRGKCLGDHPTAAQWDTIQQGTFEDMYLGDYWSGGGGWQIVHFNYYRDKCGYFWQQFSAEWTKARARAQMKMGSSANMGENTPNHVVVMQMKCCAKNVPYLPSDKTSLAVSHMDSQFYGDGLSAILGTTFHSVFGPYTDALGAVHHYGGLEILEQCDSAGYPTGYAHTWLDTYVPSFEQIFGFRPPCTDGKVYVPGYNDGPSGLQADSPRQFAYFQIANIRGDYNNGSAYFLRNFGGPRGGKQTIWCVRGYPYIAYRANAQRLPVTYQDAQLGFRAFTCIAGGSDCGVL